MQVEVALTGRYVSWNSSRSPDSRFDQAAQFKLQLNPNEPPRLGVKACFGAEPFSGAQLLLLFEQCAGEDHAGAKSGHGGKQQKTAGRIKPPVRHIKPGQPDAEPDIEAHY